MELLSFRSYAKVNVGLQILNQRPDGFHNINTLFQELDFFDTIELQKRKNGCEFSSNVNWLENNDSNLCVLAWKKFSEKYGIGGVSIKLDKNLPSGGGLGGGSSNAATILKGLCSLYSIRPKDEELRNIAKDLGADVPFFLKGGLQSASGIGECLIQHSGCIQGTYLIIIPSFKIDTSWAYNSYKKILEDEKEEVNFAGLLEKDEIPFKLFENDFESIICPSYPEIGVIRDELLANNACYASLSGSGSTVYAIFNDKADAESAELQLSKSHITLITTP